VPLVVEHVVVGGDKRGYNPMSTLSIDSLGQLLKRPSSSFLLMAVPTSSSSLLLLF